MNNRGNYTAEPTRFPGIPNHHQPLVVCDSQAKTESMNNNSNPRKRCRDALNTTALDDYVSSQIQQHQLEIHNIISQQGKRLRLELQERQRQQASLLVWAIGQRVREKEDEIQRMCKLNRMLEERVRSLFVENQLWRDLAQANEATANSLRTDLEQVLLIHEEERLLNNSNAAAAVAEEEDVGSCCGSSDDVATDKNGWRKCGRCGERDSCVLLLPCRHLCLCEVCGSGEIKREEACPICNTNMKATLHLNLFY